MAARRLGQEGAWDGAHPGVGWRIDDLPVAQHYRKNLFQASGSGPPSIFSAPI